MQGNHLHRLVATGRLEHDCIRPDLLENAAQRLSNQHVIVDD
jgi:hypothetical protein